MKWFKIIGFIRKYKGFADRIVSIIKLIEKHEEIAEFIKIAIDAFKDGKLTREEKKQLIDKGSEVFKAYV